MEPEEAGGGEGIKSIDLMHPGCSSVSCQSSARAAGTALVGKLQLWAE